MWLPLLLIKQLESLEGVALCDALRKYKANYSISMERVNGELWAKSQRAFYGKCLTELEGMEDALYAGTGATDSGGSDTDSPSE